MRVRVTRATENNWYKVGEEYEVESKTRHRNSMDYYPLVDDANVGIGPEHCEIVEEQPKFPFKVRCVDDGDAESYLTVGKVYVVTKMYLDEDYYIDEVGGYWGKRRFEIVNDDNILGPKTYMPDHEEEKFYAQQSRNKYMREVKPGVWIDVYDLLQAFDVSDPCLQHLIKKALAAGKRGHKDALTDYKDILASAKRALELYEEWNTPAKNDF
jgi:hypothetical protein